MAQEMNEPLMSKCLRRKGKILMERNTVMERRKAVTDDAKHLTETKLFYYYYFGILKFVY